MHLAIAVASYVGVATVMLCLFCLAMRYFNYRLERSIEDEGNEYSLVEGIEAKSEDLEDFEYDEFLLKRAEQKKGSEGNHKKVEGLRLDVKEISEPFSQDHANIYTPSHLRNSAFSPYSRPGSVRSMVSPKYFMPDRLESPNNVLRFNSPKSKYHQTPTNRKPKITVHKYISKIVAYTHEGISVVENKVKEIWRKSPQTPILENRQICKSFIIPNEEYFKSFLEANGFDVDCYEAYRIQNILQIPNMKLNEVYSVTSLKCRETKSEMNFHSFYFNKEELQKQDQVYSELSDS